MELATDAGGWSRGSPRNAADLLRHRQHPGRIAEGHFEMIGAASAQLGERALRAGDGLQRGVGSGHVKVVGAGQLRPFCRLKAIVHHGGSGTTAS